MNILAVDDERIQLEELEEAIKEAIPDAAVISFRKPKEALEYVKELKTKDSHVDLAFLDVEMSVMNGLELAKELKEIYKKTNIVFVTGYSQYAVDAFSVPACDYIMKPVSKDGVLKAMERLRNPIKEHGHLAVAPDKISCDMYDYLKAGNSAIKNYTGKLMMQYSWAEFLL